MNSIAKDLNQAFIEIEILDKCVRVMLCNPSDIEHFTNRALGFQLAIENGPSRWESFPRTGYLWGAEVYPHLKVPTGHVVLLRTGEETPDFHAPVRLPSIPFAVLPPGLTMWERLMVRDSID